VSKFTLALKAGIDGVRKLSGIEPDIIVCGSDETAKQIRGSLDELNLDLHIIVDDELSKKRYWITTQKALGEFEGGGQN
jgi:hypothetical protein